MRYLSGFCYKFLELSRLDPIKLIILKSFENIEVFVKSNIRKPDTINHIFTQLIEYYYYSFDLTLHLLQITKEGILKGDTFWLHMFGK